MIQSIMDLNESLVNSIEKAILNYPHDSDSELERRAYIAGTVDMIKHCTQLWKVEPKPYIMYFYKRLVGNGVEGIC